MKKLKKLFSFITIGVLLVANVIPVSAVEKEKNVKAESLADLDLGEYSQYIMDDNSINKIKPQAPAPALTSLQLYAIYSEKAGQEIIGSPNQVGSRLDHGGTWFQAITVEIGYAKSRFAYFSGSRMTLTDIEPIDLNNDRIVDGFVCLWTYEGYHYESGTFTANSTSANSPWNTISLRFNVY